MQCPVVGELTTSHIVAYNKESDRWDTYTSRLSVSLITRRVLFSLFDGDGQIEGPFGLLATFPGSAVVH